MLVCAEEPAKEGDLVVAIDFGTSRSAVAYTIAGYDDELVKVTKLSGATPYVQGDYKTSTSVLLDRNEVRAFGFDAEHCFASEERASSADWMLFKWFKMNLHNPTESDPFIDCFGGGAKLRLSEIVQKSLEYVKKDILGQLKLEGLIQTEEAKKLFWILTVPAIWSDHAKYVMRKAAFKAGLIESEQSCHLLLALEPECAAIASQKDTFQQKIWDQGARFLIADCGGGTLDITSHEVVQSSPLKLKELAQPVGGPFGATLVDKNFLKFFETLVGKENFRRLQREEPAEYLGLVKEWEEKKIMFRFDRKENWIRVNAVNAIVAMGIEGEFGSMIDAWNEKNPNKVVDRLSRRIKLSLSYDLMASFFEGVVSNIVEQISDVVSTCPGLDYVVMAGGFAKCVLLQQKVRERFEATSVNVILANDPDLLIVKGAAMFGARPMAAICSRKSRYTFGIRTTQVYDDGSALHRKYKKKSFWKDGKERLSVFDVHGRVGDDLDGSKRINMQSYLPLRQEQKSCNIPVLITKEHNVFHESEDGVRELASTRVPLNMDLPFGDRKVWVEFLFGGTEVRCLVYDETGDKEIGSVPLLINFFT